jgi:hypothetical protein
VVFRLHPNRETEFLKPLLSTFKGTVVTDFMEDTMRSLVRNRNAMSI